MKININLPRLGSTPRQEEPGRENEGAGGGPPAGGPTPRKPMGRRLASYLRKTFARGKPGGSPGADVDKPLPPLPPRHRPAPGAAAGMQIDKPLPPLPGQAATPPPLPPRRKPTEGGPPVAPPLPPPNWHAPRGAPPLPPSLGPRAEKAPELQAMRRVADELAVSGALSTVGQNAMKALVQSFPGLDDKQRPVDTLTTATFEKKLAACVGSARTDIDHRLESGMKQKLRLPGQTRARLTTAKEQAGERLETAFRTTLRQEGWNPAGKTNVKWEAGNGPLLVKRGMSFEDVQPHKLNIAQGSFGSVSIFKNLNGDQLIGKVSKGNMKDRAGKTVDDLGMELDVYKQVYDKVGPHPNLVNTFGIGTVQIDGVETRAMLMDHVPGPTGAAAFDNLHLCWQSGKIKTEEYWSAVQSIGRQMLEVTEHLGQAGLVHNDIKPENMIVNEHTGAAVVIDLGLASAQHAKHRNGTPKFMAPEARRGTGVDEKSDVFTVGASLLHGVERDILEQAPDGKLQWRNPNKGLLKTAVVLRDSEGNARHAAGFFSADTAYTNFMKAVLKPDKNSRLESPDSSLRSPSAVAADMGFLNDSMLDDATARGVIKKAIKEARMHAADVRGKAIETLHNADWFDAIGSVADALPNHPPAPGAANAAQAALHGLPPETRAGMKQFAEQARALLNDPINKRPIADTELRSLIDAVRLRLDALDRLQAYATPDMRRS